MKNIVTNLLAGCFFGGIGGLLGGILVLMYPPAGVELADQSILPNTILVGCIFGLAVALAIISNPIIKR
jgi:hypothetical protein